MTSRFVLDALEQNGEGHLSSVDLPSVDSRFHSQIGIAVPERHRDRWTYVQGTSRQRLPRLLADLGEVDLFIHDSVHTGSTTRFEIDRAWEVLRPGGALLVDDVYSNLAFADFVETMPATMVHGRSKRRCQLQVRDHPEGGRSGRSPARKRESRGSRNPQGLLNRMCFWAYVFSLVAIYVFIQLHVRGQ